MPLVPRIHCQCGMALSESIFQIVSKFTEDLLIQEKVFPTLCCNCNYVNNILFTDIFKCAIKNLRQCMYQKCI